MFEIDTKWPRIRNFVRFFGVILIRLYFEMGPFEQKLDYVWQLLKTCVKDAKNGWWKIKFTFYIIRRDNIMFSILALYCHHVRFRQVPFRPWFRLWFYRLDQFKPIWGDRSIWKKTSSWKVFTFSHQYHELITVTLSNFSDNFPSSFKLSNFARFFQTLLGSF